MIVQMTDGSDWSKQSNRFNDSEEMMYFDKLVGRPSCKPWACSRTVQCARWCSMAVCRCEGEGAALHQLRRQFVRAERSCAGSVSALPSGKRVMVH